jgi:hypothetical protein
MATDQRRYIRVGAPVRPSNSRPKLDRLRQGLTWLAGTEPRRLRQQHVPTELREQPATAGLCLSGGGMRSASFNLGVLQELQLSGSFPSRVTSITAVSGGSYPILAWLTSAAYSPTDSLEDVPPWSPGSPEERRLRNNLDFMAQGLFGAFYAVTTFVTGVILNAAPVFVLLVLLGQTTGWLLRLGLKTGLESPKVGYVRITPAFGLVVPAGAGCALLLILFAMMIQHPSDHKLHRSSRILRRLALLTLGTTGIWATVVSVLPATVWFYRYSLVQLNSLLRMGKLLSIREIDENPFPGFRGLLSIGILAGLIAAGTGFVLLRLYQRGIARWFVAVFTPAVGLAMLVFPFCIGASHGLRHQFQSNEAKIAAVELATVLFFAFFVHNNQYSLHGYYRDRLSSVFCVSRTPRAAASTRVGHEDAEEHLTGTFSEAYQLASGPYILPEIVVCAAVATPPHAQPFGLGSASFRIGADHAGTDMAQFKTSTLEQGRGTRRSHMTTASFMAISGAAVAPWMGRLTRPFLRSLMALLNIRLGVWLPAKEPNPNTTDTPRLIERLRRGWREPGAFYVFREAFGWVSNRDKFLYVSDGGHWDNLGLIELLRTGVSTAFCIDCTLGKTDSGFSKSFAFAIQLARTELGLEIELDEGDQKAGANDDSMVRELRGTYPGDAGRSTVQIVYVRPKITKSTPLDIVELKDKEFPYHATQSLRYPHERFESYRRLGAQAGGEIEDRLSHFSFRERQPTVHAATPETAETVTLV